MCSSVRTRNASHPDVAPTPHDHKVTDMCFVHAVVGDVSYSVDDVFGLEFDGFHNALEGGAAGHFADLGVIDWIVEVVHECGVIALGEQRHTAQAHEKLSTAGRHILRASAGRHRLLCCAAIIWC